MTIHRLRGMRCMMSGAMDAMPDHGAGWRLTTKSWLWSREVEVFDPCNKPCERGEEIESKVMRDALIERKDWRTLKACMKIIRNIDLRMITLADFVLVYLNREEPTCGTWEELAVATVQKKPVIVIYEQGRKAVPHWLVAQVPTTTIFSTFEQAYKYLDYIDTSEAVDDLGKWIFFDYDRLKVTYAQKEEEENR